MTYSEKLKDPRWQKKRLQILNRDGWSCWYCGDQNGTLHVHHEAYIGSNPWEAPDVCLMTLCEECHVVESMNLTDLEHLLIKSLKNRHLREYDMIKLINSNVKRLANG